MTSELTTVVITVPKDSNLEITPFIERKKENVKRPSLIYYADLIHFSRVINQSTTRHALYFASNLNLITTD
jgi:hypothetical protein